MKEGMMGSVVGALLAVERGDLEGFNLLLDDAQRDDPRGFVMAAVGTAWQLANELGQAKGTSAAAVLEDLALLADEGDAGSPISPMKVEAAE